MKGSPVRDRASALLFRRNPCAGTVLGRLDEGERSLGGEWLGRSLDHAADNGVVSDNSEARHLGVEPRRPRRTLSLPPEVAACAGAEQVALRVDVGVNREAGEVDA